MVLIGNQQDGSNAIVAGLNRSSGQLFVSTRPISNDHEIFVRHTLFTQIVVAGVTLGKTITRLICSGGHDQRNQLGFVQSKRPIKPGR